jgi:hypothetical protein
LRQLLRVRGGRVMASRLTAEYRVVTATPEEIAEFKRRHQGFPPGVYRLECRACGRRIWGSGLGVGSHRRACKGPKPPISDYFARGDYALEGEVRPGLKRSETAGGGD